MNRIRVRRAIRQIARREGVGEEKIIEDISFAIAESRRQAYLCGDIAKIRMWESIPKKGEIPTAYEMIAFIGAQVK